MFMGTAGEEGLAGALGIAASEVLHDEDEEDEEELVDGSWMFCGFMGSSA